MIFEHNKKINTLKFIDDIITSIKISHVIYVPCSYLKYLINGFINDGRTEMIIAANEAIATSIAVGIKASGGNPLLMMQSSGFCNASSPITSCVVPGDIHIATIVSWRKVNDDSDDIQHSVLSNNLEKFVLATGVDWFSKLNIHNLLESSRTTGICWVGPDAFSKVELKNTITSTNPLRTSFLKILNNHYKNENIKFIATTGNTNNEMYKFCNNLNIFYMTGNMGSALSIGFGFALNKTKTIVCGGDSEFQMHLGGLITCENDVPLTYIIFDNKVNKSTGGQQTKHCDIIKITTSMGYNTFYTNDLTQFENILNNIDQNYSNCTNIILVECSLDKSFSRPPKYITEQSIKGK